MQDWVASQTPTGCLALAGHPIQRGGTAFEEGSTQDDLLRGEASAVKAVRSSKQLLAGVLASVVIAAAGQWVLSTYLTWDVVTFGQGVPLQGVADVASRYQMWVVRLEAPSTLFRQIMEPAHGYFEPAVREAPDQLITRITVRGALSREKIGALTGLRPDDIKQLSRYLIMPGRWLRLELGPRGLAGRLYALLAFHILLQAGLFVIVRFVGHVNYYTYLRREIREQRNP